MSLLQKKFLDPNPDFFGLDISDLSIKVVQVDVRGKYMHNVLAGAESLPKGSVADGGILNAEAVGSAIQAACLRANITTKHVVCSLPETKAFLRIISIPQMTSEEAGEAIKWEMEANIPMTIDQVYYDWQILPEHLQGDAGKMSVLVVAVARGVVDQFMAVLEDANYKVHGFEIESLSQVRSLLSLDHQRTTMIVDIGDRRTSFLVVTRGIPVFTSSIPLSSESITDAIAKTMNLSHAEAEKVKIEHGIGSALKNDHIFQSVKPIVDSFAQEIRKSINFYLTGLRYSQAVDEIILCGGGSKTKGLIPYLSRSIGMDVRLGDPWTNAQFKDLPPINKEASIQYATAIGLSMTQD